MIGIGKLGEKEFFDLYLKVVIEILIYSLIEWDDRFDRVFVNGDKKNDVILKIVIGIYEI